MVSTLSAMQIVSKLEYICLSAQGSVWPIADDICFHCKVNGGWPRPLLTYYEVNKNHHLLLFAGNKICSNLHF